MKNQHSTQPTHATRRHPTTLHSAISSPAFVPLFSKYRNKHGRDDLPSRSKRSARRQFGALSRSNVKSSGLYVRRRRERAVTRERFSRDCLRIWRFWKQTRTK
ncbi:hypothetical protein CYJ66_00350 [Gardnerella vaginalis]|nr:hypothetical protein CYJ66_00350 [Gardnerella vaginalis]PKZ55376.1 hypothetical protein CYJ64_00350 [Gardnerella vaginalis]